MKTICCTKCERFCQVTAGQIANVLAEAPGWGFVWDQSDGLTTAFYCAECMPVIKKLFVDLREALGRLDIRYAHFGGIGNQLNAADAPARPSPDPGT